MSEQEQPRGRGRPPKKHLEQEHHFSPAIQPFNNGAPEIIEAVVENFTVETAESHIAQESESVSLTEEISVPHVTIFQHEESPVEEKIHQLVESSYSVPSAVELNGWHTLNTDIVIFIPPRNGMPVLLCETPDGQGIEAFWKRTRAFANGTKRWNEHGAWYDFNTGTPIRITPKYWKERF